MRRCFSRIWWEDHAERALHAALSMQHRLEELFGDALSLRIGVNTGDVVVGQPREGSSFVTGDAVNVAARLEQAAEPGEILVGERTAAAVGGAFEFHEPSTVAARGKAGGVACRRLVRALSLMRPRGVGGLGHSFVGRERELEALQQAYGGAVEEREPRLVTIMGDAGIGKMALIREFWEWLGSQSPEPCRRTGRCLSYGRGITYMPLGEIVREHFGLLESDAPDTVRHRLGDRAILGLTLGLEAPADLHPLAARDRLRQAWVAFLEELVAEQPAVVLVEDLHWADEALLDLLEAGLHDVRGPLLLLATARPELVHSPRAWGGGARGRDGDTFWLEALSPSDTSRMIDELIPAVLPAPVRAVVIDRAEGNPFFVEELVRTLIDQGVLERRNGGWTARELSGDFVVPDNVQAVLAARIDLLAPADKAGLQAAAVIGRTFWSGPVYELLEGVEPDLRLLEERDFYVMAIAPAVASGHFDEARRYAVSHEEVTHRLSPHHRLHGVAASLELEELLGDWNAASRLQPRVEDAVAANVATPCVRNQRSLLVCALARAYLGDEKEACRLEQEAEAYAMTGHGTVLYTPRVQLALLRDDLAAVESLLGEPRVRRSSWRLSSMATHLDGLAALGERARVEAEASRLLQPNTYLEPFALRALGLVREDANLIECAADRFEAFGLDWHAARTRALLQSVR